MINRGVFFASLFAASLFLSACEKPVPENPFWLGNNQQFETKKVFDSSQYRGQHPNVVVAKNGSVITTFGRDRYQISRSDDGGETWSPIEVLADPGFQGGGVTVDERSGNIFVFVEEHHPPAKQTVFKSGDHGKTWQQTEIEIRPDSKGNMPDFHMNESGITLQFGEHAGRLIRPSRHYAGSNDRENWKNHYTNAMYSDDGGKTWQTSEPFPAYGTGEAAIAELSDGRIYYNSRRHLSTDGLNPRMRYIAWSYDGGHTWEDLSVSDVLPDGAQHVDYGLMAGLVRLPVDGHDILLFSNIDVPALDYEVVVPHHLRTTRRERGTVWASFDGGKTWPVSKLITEGSFSYSSLAAGRKDTPSEGWIYLMYEQWEQPRHGHMVRFNLDWLTDGRDWKTFLPG